MTFVTIGNIQRRLAWPLRKDDTQNREAKNSIFFFWTGVVWGSSCPPKDQPQEPTHGDEAQAQPPWGGRRSGYNLGFGGGHEGAGGGKRAVGIYQRLWPRKQMKMTAVVTQTCIGTAIAQYRFGASAVTTAANVSGRYAQPKYITAGVRGMGEAMGRGTKGRGRQSEE